MYDYNPVDVDISVHHVLIGRLLDDILLGKYEYKELSLNPGIIDYMFLHQDPERVICKKCKDQKHSFKVFYGSVLFNTLNNYVIDDMPLHDLKFFPQFNGQRFSELNFMWQRYVIESQVDLFIDHSMEESDCIIESYLDTVRGYAEG